MFHRSVTRSVALGIAVFFASLATVAGADSTGTVTLSVQTESLSISITGAEVVFDKGPYGPGTQIFAHPDPAADAVAPQIQNTGNVNINSLVVDFVNSPQASCGDDPEGWTVGLAPGEDTFMLRALASSTVLLADFQGTGTMKYPVDPITGTDDLLVGSLLAPDVSVPLLLQLVTPNPATTGGAECTIDLTVTATAG